MKEIFYHIWQVTLRELRRMVSRPLYLMSSVGAFLFSLFFYMTLMKAGAAVKMPVAVVDHDQSSISRRLMHEMQATPSVDIQLVTNNYAEARGAMQSGKIYGILVIPDGFYSRLASFKRPQVDFYVTNAYTVGGNTAYKQMLVIVNLVSGAFQREVLRKKGMSDEVIMNRIQPVSVDAHMIANPWGNYTIYLVSTVLPGILGVIALMLTVFAVGVELKRKTSREWLRTAGGNYTVAMIGKLIPYTVIFMSLGAVCYATMYNLSGFPVLGSHWRLLFGMLLFIMAMEVMGVVLIGCLPTLRDALSVGALYAMLGFSLSGFTFPTGGMLPVVQALSNLEPLRHYYIIYVNEALMGAPAMNSMGAGMALVAFMIPALCVAPRLHRALIYQNYPLK